MSEVIRKNGRLWLREYGGEKETELLDGPWHAERDRVEFRHAGFPCLALRNDAGTWCGYVAIPAGHPWRGNVDPPSDLPEITYVSPWRGNVDPSDLPEITYVSPCKGDICHVPLPGESEDILWFGFDCGHNDEFPPRDATNERIAWRTKLYKMWGLPLPPENRVYRDIAYVEGKLRLMADRAHDAAQKMAAA